MIPMTVGAAGVTIFTALVWSLGAYTCADAAWFISMLSWRDAAALRFAIAGTYLALSCLIFILSAGSAAEALVEPEAEKAP